MRVGELVSRYQGSANLGGFLQAQVWKGSFLVCVGSYGVPSSMDDGVIHLKRNFPFYVCVPFDAPPVFNSIELAKTRDSRRTVGFRREHTKEYVTEEKIPINDEGRSFS